MHVFAGFFALNLSTTTVYTRTAFCTQPAFYSQSAVCILHSVCILPLVRSLQSAVRGLRFTLTDINYHLIGTEFFAS